MKRFMKVSIFSFIMMFLISINVGAENLETNIGVSEDPPIGAENEEGISPDGLDKPTTSVNLNNGNMPFAGSANISPLYTNNFFTGASNVSIEVHNNHSKTLKYKLYKSGKLLAVETFSLKPGQSQISHRTLESSGKYYIKFEAPSSFSGSVSKG